MALTYTWTPTAGRISANARVSIRTWNGESVPEASYIIDSGKVVITVPRPGRYHLRLSRGPLSESVNVDVHDPNASDVLPSDTLDYLNTRYAFKHETASRENIMDIMAEIQGAVYHYSSTAPSTTTYTAASGTVYPVVWVNTAATPASPVEPTWDNMNSSYLIPKVVGVDYYNGLTKLTPDTVFKAPIKAKTTITAKAQYGYVLPAVYQWSHDFPDPNDVSIMSSDAFTGTNTTTIFGRTMDNGLGGTATTIYDIDQPVWSVKDGLLEANSIGSWNKFQFPGVVNMRMELDLLRHPVGQNIMWSAGGASGSGGITFVIDSVSATDVRIRYLAANDVGGNSEAAPEYVGPAILGTYKLQIYGNTASWEVPGRSAIHMDISKFQAATDTRYGDYCFLTVSTSTVPTQAAQLDNLVVSKLGW